VFGTYFITTICCYGTSYCSTVCLLSYTLVYVLNNKYRNNQIGDGDTPNSNVNSTFYCNSLTCLTCTNEQYNVKVFCCLTNPFQCTSMFICSN